MLESLMTRDVSVTSIAPVTRKRPWKISCLFRRNDILQRISQRVLFIKSLCRDYFRVNSHVNSTVNNTHAS